jgi:hypothetical protein
MVEKVKVGQSLHRVQQYFTAALSISHQKCSMVILIVVLRLFSSEGQAGERREPSKKAILCPTSQEHWTGNSFHVAIRHIAWLVYV